MMSGVVVRSPGSLVVVPGLDPAYLPDLGLLQPPLGEPQRVDQVEEPAAEVAVTDRRVGYLEELFGELGFAADVAHQRAVLAYSIYLGQAQLLSSTPHVVKERRALLDETLAVVMCRA